MWQPLNQFCRRTFERMRHKSCWGSRFLLEDLIMEKLVNTVIPELSFEQWDTERVQLFSRPVTVHHWTRDEQHATRNHQSRDAVLSEYKLNTAYEMLNRRVNLWSPGIENTQNHTIVETKWISILMKRSSLSQQLPSQQLGNDGVGTPQLITYFRSLTYVNGCSGKINKLLKNYIGIGLKSRSTKYIGHTRSYLETRIANHRSDARLGKTDKCATTLHALENHHSLDFDGIMEFCGDVIY